MPIELARTNLDFLPLLASEHTMGLKWPKGIPMIVTLCSLFSKRALVVR